ncbi:MAG: polysaccharide deacetylase family protein [Desulfuromonadaceae bacterium]
MMRRVGLDGLRLGWARARNIGNLARKIAGKVVVVLCYHRVARVPSDINALAVTPENFRDQLNYLKNNFQLVRFEDDWTDLERTAVAVTFDDGYADNLQVALPIIEEVGVPATFFISSAAVGNDREFWWDELERLTLDVSGYPNEFRLQDTPQQRIWPTATFVDRLALFRQLHPLLLQAGAEQRVRWLEQIRVWAGERKSTGVDNRLLTAAELRALAASPWVSIGAHTISHPRLAGLSEAEQRREIFGCKEQLEALLGREMVLFSYPYGKKSDYSPTSVRLCREAGFHKAAAAFPGLVRRGTDPLQIPRHFVYNGEARTLANYFQGCWIR